MEKKSLFINLLAGPGTGKTTFVYFLSYLMKKRGYNIEFEQEVAKKLVYAQKFDILNNQLHITETQVNKFNDLDGHVDFIITDGSILHGLWFNKNNPHNLSDLKETEEFILESHFSMNTVNIFLKRNLEKEYEQTGRIQSFEESLEIDKELKAILVDKGIDFKEFVADEIYAEAMIDYILYKKSLL